MKRRKDKKTETIWIQEIGENRYNFWGYMNIYFQRPIKNSIHPTREDADKWALHDRSACVPINEEFEALHSL